jgi:hypothetical protein
VIDEKGSRLDGPVAAEMEAAHSLADIIRDAASISALQSMSIEVLDEARKLLFVARVAFERI